jgi:hypothetical protein
LYRYGNQHPYFSLKVCSLYFPTAAGTPVDNGPVVHRMERVEYFVAVIARGLEPRQDIPTPADASFAPEASFTDSTRATSATGAGSPPTSAPNSGGGGNTIGSGGRSGGLSKGSKIGLGIGIPLALLIIGGGIGLAMRLWRKLGAQDPANDQSVALPPGGQVEDQKHQAPVGPGIPELSQSAMYTGHEMPTKENTAEMPAPIPQGYEPVQGQISTGVHYPQQQWVQNQPVYGQQGQGPPQFSQPVQHQYGQQPYQYVPTQQSAPSELPERRQ